LRHTRGQSPLGDKEGIGRGKRRGREGEGRKKGRRTVYANASYDLRDVFSQFLIAVG